MKKLHQKSWFWIFFPSNHESIVDIYLYFWFERELVSENNFHFYNAKLLQVLKTQLRDIKINLFTCISIHKKRELILPKVNTQPTVQLWEWCFKLLGALVYSSSDRRFLTGNIDSYSHSFTFGFWENLIVSRWK